MTTIRKTRIPLGPLPWAAVAVLLVAGCGTHRAGDVADAPPSPYPTATGISPPAAPVDFPCPGESPAPTAAATTAGSTGGSTTGSTEAPADHYAENHAFRMPLPLHGQSRCDGLAAVERVEKALEPLRRRGDFAPESVRGTLTGLGYPAGKVRANRNGPTGVGFLIDVGASPWCVEGTLNSDSTRASAFGGYPDGTGCEPPRGGH
ncbi:hypothetical protein ABT403_33650 [Streptomyces sp. NPDC000075]